MAGHSKWAQIKRKKAVTDAKRGQAFTRHARLITIAAKDGGGDPSKNFKLRLAIDNARKTNMPNDTIDRAVAKGTGEGDGAAITSAVYEAYGPAKSALLVEAVTDNTNRTLTDVQQALTKNDGTMGKSGSVAWQFSRKGYLTFPASARTDELELALIEAGTDEIEEQDGMLAAMCAPEAFADVKNALDTAGIAPDDEQISTMPNDAIDVSDEERERIDRLTEALEDIDDVVSVTTNVGS